VGDDSHFEFLQKPLGEDGSVRRGVVMVKQPGPFSPKFGAMSSQVSTQSPPNVAVETRIHILACWEKSFVPPQLLYRWRHQSGILWIPHRISTHSRCSFLSCCIHRHFVLNPTIFHVSQEFRPTQPRSNRE
jgi:hypothetical protein